MWPPRIFPSRHVSLAFAPACIPAQSDAHARLRRPSAVAPGRNASAIRVAEPTRAAFPNRRLLAPHSMAAACDRPIFPRIHADEVEARRRVGEDGGHFP